MLKRIPLNPKVMRVINSGVLDETTEEGRLFHIGIHKNKSLDPLRAKKTFIMMKDDGPDCTISEYQSSSVTLYYWLCTPGKIHFNLERVNAVDLQTSTSPKVVQNI